MGVKIREKLKGSGVYWVFVAQNGRRRSLKAGSYDVAEEVAKRLTIKLADDPDSVFKGREKPKPLFKTVVKQWLEVSTDSCKASTLERYEQMYRDYIADELDSKRIDQIDRQHVMDILLGMRKRKLSRSSIDLARGCISGPMQFAIFQGVIQSDPTIGVLKQLRLNRGKKGSNKVKAMDEDQARNFLSGCQEHRPESYELFAVLLGTGMRLGEALALTWTDIDFKTKTARINKSYRRQLSTTKTKKAREVALGDELYSILRRLKASKMKEGKGKVSPLLFHSAEGDHIHQNSVRNVFGQMLKKADLPKFRVHDLRHTFATLALRAGTAVQMVSQQLGHSSIAITMDVYGHLIPQDNQDFVSRLGNTLLKSEMHPTRTLKSKKAANR